MTPVGIGAAERWHPQENGSIMKVGLGRLVSEQVSGVGRCGQVWVCDCTVADPMQGEHTICMDRNMPVWVEQAALPRKIKASPTSVGDRYARTKGAVRNRVLNRVLVLNGVPVYTRGTQPEYGALLQERATWQPLLLPPLPPLPHPLPTQREPSPLGFPAMLQPGSSIG